MVDLPIRPPYKNAETNTLAYFAWASSGKETKALKHRHQVDLDEVPAPAGVKSLLASSQVDTKTQDNVKEVKEARLTSQDEVEVTTTTPVMNITDLQVLPREPQDDVVICEATGTVFTTLLFSS